MSKFCHNIIECIGETPVVRLDRIAQDAPAEIFAKLEFFNPLGSVKDRVGAALINDAEQRGLLSPGATLVEPTSGNTGIALAMVCSARGYNLKIVMPDSYSVERQVTFRALGAKLELTPGRRGMGGAVRRAQQLAAKGAIMLQQFENPANPKAHEDTTGPEIWEALDGDVDAVVAGVGTGGTITGVTRALRKNNPQVRAFAVEPAECAVLSGGRPAPHGIEGIGAGFVPRNLDRTLLDGVVKISTEEAMVMARKLAREEGLFVGISSGANIAAALKVAKLPIMRGKRIVTFCCSSADRYVSTPLFDPYREK